MSVLNQISISCPACKSKYLISKETCLEAELKEKIDLLANKQIQSFSANFHCSGCDYTFNLELKTSNLLETDNLQDQQTSIQEIIINPESADIGNTSYEFEQNSADQTQVIDHDILDEVILEQQSHKIEDVDWESDSSLITATPGTNKDIAQPEFTNTFKLSSKSPSATSYNLKDLASSSPEFNQETQSDSFAEQEDYSKYAVDNYSDNDSDYSERTRQQNLWNSEQSPKTYSKQQYQDSGQTLMDSKRPDLENLSFVAPKPNNSINFAESSNANRSSGSTAMLIIIPVLVTLAILSGITFHLENNLKSADTVFITLFPSSLREPPAGLFILEPNIRPLVLESGDIVNVAQGRLVNKTNKTFSAVQIEGIGFSSSGQLSQREKIMLGNPVSNRTVKLKTLAPSNIKEIQNKIANKSIKFRPNSEQDFIFVFTDPVSPRVLEKSKNNETQDINSKDMSSYALRIYAVR